MIKDALSSLPAKPALYIAPIIAVLVLVYYYWDLHARCTEMRQQRTALSEHLQALPLPTSVRLEELTGFAWDKVRIAVDLKGAQRSVECPFGWNWPAGERDALIETGRLTGLIFGMQDSIVAYLELRGDEIVFRGVDSVLTPETAVFAVSRGRPAGMIELNLSSRAGPGLVTDQ